MALLGLDIGTTGCKAIAFDHRGTLLARAYREYAIDSPRPGWAEQDAERVYALAMECLAEVIGQTRSNPPEALALSAQGEAVMPVDGAGRPLRPVILGMDTRTTAENAWLAERFTPEAIFERTGMPLHTINTLPKLIWLKRNEPDVYERASQFLLYEDFFLKRLTGEAVIGHCLASRTQMYDLRRGEWAGDILESCGIDGNKLARLGPAEGGVIGTLRREVADALGIDQIPIAGGGHDQACAALGSGVIHEGQAMVSTGTAEVVEVALKEPTLAPAVRQGGISVYRHAAPGLYVAMTLNHSGGLALRWFRDEFCEPQMARSAAGEGSAYDLMQAGAPEGPTGLLTLPHFSGSGTPWLDTASRGAVVGLTFSSNRAALAKAILEGLTYELRINIDLLQGAGAGLRELHAVGGGASSPLWLRLKADICNIPLQVPRVTEAACLGAAMLAGVASGVWRNVEESVASCVAMDRRVEPDPAAVTAYERFFRLYERVYPALAPIMHEL